MATTIPTNLQQWAAATPTQRFLQSRETGWADKYGGVVPYYPQQRYIDQNLAPELNMTNSQLEALAAANQQALKSGLMSPKLASKMLPTLLTEGASGINGWGYADLPKYRQLLEKAGLPPTIEEIKQARMNARDDFERELINTKLMHALMAAKASLYGEDKAVERWNGQGKSDSYTRPADAANHARKVEELDRLLKHPKNKELMDKWAEYSARHSGQGVEVMHESPPVYTWVDENLPGILAAPANALVDAANVSKNAFVNAQRAIRNWTSP